MINFKNKSEDIHPLEALCSKGYVVLENLFERAEIDRLNAELEPWFGKTPRCQGDFYGWDTTRFDSVLRKAPSSQSLVAHPAILEIVEGVLGPYCDWFQLHVVQAARIHPGAEQQPIHRDDAVWPCPKPHDYLINVIWALDDFTIENGATRIWPGSQHLSPAEDVSERDSDAAEMSKGSVVMILGSTKHCAGANMSSQDRTGLIVGYSLGWLKQYENQFLSYPPDVARDFPPAIQDLIGYRIHRPNLGGYEGNCPTVLFDDERPDSLPTIDAFTPEIEQQLLERRRRLDGHANSH